MQSKTIVTIALAVISRGKQSKYDKLEERCWVSRDPRNRNNKREKRRNVESAVVSPKKKNSGPAMLAVMLSGDEVVVVLFLDVHLLNVFVQVDGSDVTEYVRDLNGGSWSRVNITIPDE